MAGFGSGWIKDDEDDRDNQWPGPEYVIRAPGGHGIAPEMDLRSRFAFDVYDQGPIGSCTANAIAAAVRVARDRVLGTHDASFEPSRLFQYYNSRLMNRTGKTTAEQAAVHDTGARIRDAFKALRRFGACPENEWPYKDVRRAVDLKDGWKIHGWDIHSSAGSYPTPVRPSSIDDMDAWYAANRDKWLEYLGTKFAYFKIAGDTDLAADSPILAAKRADGKRIETNDDKLQQMRRALTAGFPVVFGTPIYGYEDDEGNPWEDMYENRISEAGVRQDPPEREDNGKYPEPESRHAMLAVGYGNAKDIDGKDRDCLLVRNSWGGWGSKNWATTELGKTDMAGHFWMPIEWVTKGFISDCWVVEVTSVRDPGSGVWISVK